MSESVVVLAVSLVAFQAITVLNVISLHNRVKRLELAGEIKPASNPEGKIE